jgi:hypothetical protein
MCPDRPIAATMVRTFLVRSLNVRTSVTTYYASRCLRRNASHKSNIAFDKVNVTSQTPNTMSPHQYAFVSNASSLK